MHDAITLHGYFRSSASYRVRIALNLKGLAYENAFHHLRKREHLDPSYRAINPQALVPSLEVDGHLFTQSLAICEYLEEAHPHPPILPQDPVERAHVRAVAQVIAADVHPIQNLKILDRLRALGMNEDVVSDWARMTIEEGFVACEALLASTGGPYAVGPSVTLADIFIVPQSQCSSI